MSRRIRVRLVMPAVVRVSEVDGGRAVGLERSWDGPKAPCILKATATVGRSERSERNFMVTVAEGCSRDKLLQSVYDTYRIL